MPKICRFQLEVNRISEVFFILGLTILIPASLFLDDFWSYYDLHKRYPSLCQLSKRERERCIEIKWWICIGFAGAVVSFCQIILQAVFAMGNFIGKWKVWLMTQALFVIANLILTVMAFYYKINKFGGQSGTAYTVFLFLNVALGCYSPFLIKKKVDQAPNENAIIVGPRLTPLPSRFVAVPVPLSSGKGNQVQYIPEQMKSQENFKGQGPIGIANPIGNNAPRVYTPQPHEYENQLRKLNVLTPFKLDTTKRFRVYGPTPQDTTRRISVFQQPTQLHIEPDPLYFQTASPSGGRSTSDILNPYRGLLKQPKEDRIKNYDKIAEKSEPEQETPKKSIKAAEKSKHEQKQEHPRKSTTAPKISASNKHKRKKQITSVEKFPKEFGEPHHIEVGFPSFHETKDRIQHIGSAELKKRQKGRTKMEMTITTALEYFPESKPRTSLKRVKTLSSINSHCECLNSYQTDIDESVGTNF